MIAQVKALKAKVSVEKVRAFAQDLLLFLGFTSIFYGIHQIYIPASYIIAGAILFWIGIPAKKSVPAAANRKKDGQ